MVRGWMLAAGDGDRRIGAAALTELLAAVDGLDLNGDGSPERIAIRGGELVVQTAGGRELLRMPGVVRVQPFWTEGPYPVLLAGGMGGSDGQPYRARLHPPAGRRPLPGHTAR